MMTIIMKQRQPQPSKSGGSSSSSSGNQSTMVDDDEEDEDNSNDDHNFSTRIQLPSRFGAKKKKKNRPSATTFWWWWRWSSSIYTAIFIIFNTFVDPISTLIYDGISEYHVMEGDTISLPCNISIKEWQQNQISLMVWYRSSNQGNPIYSIDTRSSLSKSRHQIMPELNERIEMDFDQDPPRLHLVSVKPEDGGDYRCRVDYRMNRTKHFLIHLNVSVAPKNVVIRDLLGNIVQGMIPTPFNEGDKVTLFCDAIGGSPPPIVIWKNDDGKIIDDSFELLSLSNDHHQQQMTNDDDDDNNVTTVRNILHIPQLDRGHLLQEITCEAYPPLLLLASTTNATDESIPESNWNWTSASNNNPRYNNHHHHHHHHQRNSFVRRTSVVFDLNLRPLSVKIQVPNNFQPNLNRSLAGTSSSSSSSSSSSFQSPSSSSSSATFSTTNHQPNHRGNVLIVSAGKKTEIECRSWGSRPSAEITWWRASRRLPTSASRTYYGTGKLIRPPPSSSSSSSSSFISSLDDEDPSSSSSSSSTSLEQTADNDNLTISMLTYTAVLEDDGQRLTCRADNIHLEQEEIEDSVILSVRYAPLLTLSLGAKIPENIREGSDVYLECVSKSNPPLSEVVWLFEGKPLIHNPVQGILVTNQSLVMQRVRREHRGYYQCAASNPEGISASNKVFLNVHFAPVCKPSQTIIYGVARTEQVLVSCEVEAEPISPIQFRWFFNNSFETLELPQKDYTVEIIHPNHTNSMNELERKFFNNPDIIHRLSLENVFTTIATMNQHYNGQAPSVARSNATYWPRTRIGYGILYCLAENSVGPQRDPCVFTIVEAGPPNPVHDCRIVNVTMASFILECIPGENGGLRQLFHLEVYNIEKEHLQANVTSMDEPVFAVENLPHDTAFMLNVFSSNAKGRSDSVTLRTATSAYAAKHTTNGKKQKAIIFDDINQLIINPIFGALMVALFSLVLLCMATIVFIRSRFCLKNSTTRNSNGNHKVMVDNCISSSNKNNGEAKCNDNQKDKFTSLSSSCTPPIMPSSSPLLSHHHHHHNHHPHLLIGSQQQQQQQHQFSTTAESNLNQSTYYDYQPHIGAGPNTTTTSLSINDSTHTTMTDLSYHKHLEPNSYFMTSANHLPTSSSTNTVSAVSTMLHPHLQQHPHNRYTATTSDLMTNAFTYNVNATSLNNTVYPMTDDFLKVNTDMVGMANCPYNQQINTASTTIATVPRRVPLLKPIIGCMESLSSSTSDKTNDQDEEWSHLTGHHNSKPPNSHTNQIDLPPPSSSAASSFVQFTSSGPINAQNSVNS